ncbi:hypothetical protein DZF98_04785 [Clavibacter californiensis]|uniref:CdiI immunity protein domain-containing protein n=1 Tax=Clavibacter californiensis TaxID=1401995 RepID=A0ABX9NBK8_9MICO|nr:hypothetical protein DZF98_04785 [Clavibacter californiensis]
MFFAVILYIDSQDTERDTQVFEYYFAERWPGFEVDLRRAIGGLKDGTLRNRLDSLVDSATDTEIQTFHGSSPKGWARWLSDIAADLAMTASRMEEPDGELVGRYKAFFDSYTEVYMWREDRREADRGMRRDQLRHSTQ